MDLPAISRAPLTRDQTTRIKGLGILLIVLHNFFHNLPPLIGENEFSFSPVVVARFAATMASGPTEWPRALFSFLGHYGVAVFVLLSAYGLARSTAARPRPYGQFLSERFGRVYLTFVVCVGLYLVLWGVRAQVTGNPEPVPWRDLALKLTLVSNVLPNQAMSPVGPWWFVPFIFQLYAVFPLLARIGRRPAALALVACLSVALEAAVNPALMRAQLNLNHTVVGHLPLVCLGLYLASRDRLPSPWLWAGIAGMGFWAASVDPYLWLLSNVWAAILLVAVPVAVASQIALPSSLQAFFRFYGEISLPLFLVHGFLRAPFASLATSGGRWWHGVAAAALSLAFSTVMALVLDGLDRRVRALLAGRRAAAA